ncbi:MAG: hypothetical protein V4489_04335 [Chlamydiota bacterium]
MLITNKARKESIQQELKKIVTDTSQEKINLIFENTSKAKSFLNIEGSLKLFLQRFKPLGLEEPEQSLFTLAITIFKEFDPAKGCTIIQRFMSVDKTA